jgi:hypothetical protein
MRSRPYKAEQDCASLLKKLSGRIAIHAVPTLIFLLPIQYFLTFRPRSFYVAYLAIIALIARPSWRTLRQDSLLILLLVYSVLTGARLLAGNAQPSDVTYIAHPLLAMAIFMITKQYVEIHGLAVIERTLVWSMLFTVIVSAIYLYLPLPDIARGIEPMSMRLSGLVDNPNRLGKMIPIAIFVLLLRDTATAALGVALLSAALAATGSKAAILGAIVGIGLMGFYGRYSYRWRLHAYVVILGALAWWAVGVPLIEVPAAQRWKEIDISAGLRSTLEIERRQPSDFASRILKELRLNESYRMTKKGDMTKYVQRHGWTTTGQRDLLWSAGIDVALEHWLWGIGPHEWPSETQARIGFPSDSPHNAAIEVLGSFGILGMLLYLTIIVLIIRRIRRPSATWALPFVICILIIELFDVAIVLGHHNATLLFWAVVGAAVAADRNAADPRQGSSVKMSCAESGKMNAACCNNGIHASRLR